MRAVGGDTNAGILLYSNNNTHYTGGNMTKKLPDITVNTFNILCRMNDIMQEIIHLKNENRSFGQRINNLRQKRSEYIKVIKNNKGNKDILQEYNKKVDYTISSDVMLTKLQTYNSKLILKHRSKIQELRKGLV